MAARSDLCKAFEVAYRNPPILLVLLLQSCLHTVYQTHLFAFICSHLNPAVGSNINSISHQVKNDPNMMKKLDSMKWHRSFFQAQIRVSAQRLESWLEDNGESNQDRSGPRLRERDSVLLQRGSGAAPTHLSLSFPKLCVPLLQSGQPRCSYSTQRHRGSHIHIHMRSCIKLT